MDDEVVADGVEGGSDTGPGRAAPPPQSARSILLHPSDWHERRRRHRRRVDELLGDHEQRRSHGEKDPVADFLFEYYSFPPSHLRRWSPGPGIRLLAGEESTDSDASEGPDWPEFTHVDTPDGPAYQLDPSNFPDRLHTSTRWILNLLERTQERRPLFGCAGLHEWAMVYRTDRPRHDWLPMRLSADEISRVVENGPLTCSHFDAFRFFTDEARPLNARRLERSDMPDFEQGGCLHVNMDIYRWATKRAPWIDSSLIADAFEFAMRIRRVDMRASPYDVSRLGLTPIPVETEAGRHEYRTHQEAFYAEGKRLRRRLIDGYRELVGVLTSG